MRIILYFWFLVPLFTHASASASSDSEVRKSHAVTRCDVTGRKANVTSGKARVARELPSDTEKKLYVDIHNFYRCKAEASNMREVVGFDHMNKQFF